MSDKRTQATRYAQAVIQAMTERWRASLQAGAEAISKDKKLSALLADKSANLDDKLKAYQAAIKTELSTEEQNLVKLLLQEGDMGMLGEVASALAEAATGQRGPQKAEIVSAIELTQKEQESLRNKLVADYGDGLTFAFRVDPSLLGGLRVRVGDRLIDTSVASRLSALRETLSAAVR
ncbi:MAG: ATP synthase F1 subunit delta [Caldilineaceae bacterium]